MAHDSESPNGERAPLTRERILRVALRLADADGIDALTMRKLGLELGVEAMSLYHHLANKDDLVGGMFELVMEEMALPPSGCDWKTALRACAISAHDVLRLHPWASSLVMSPPALSWARLRWMDAVLGTLRQAGFSAELTHHAYHALDSHIVGFALWVASLPVKGDELRDLVQDFARTFPVEDMPHLAEHIEYHLREPDPQDEGEFAFGLDLILNGLERMRDTG